MQGHLAQSLLVSADFSLLWPIVRHIADPPSLQEVFALSHPQCASPRPSTAQRASPYPETSSQLTPAY